MLATLTMIQRMRQQHWEGRVNKPGSPGWREVCQVAGNGANVAVKGRARAADSAHLLAATTAWPGSSSDADTTYPSCTQYV